MMSMLPLVLFGLLQQAPQRDGPARPTTHPVGTASVSGVVMTDGDSPQPVRFAGVSLSQGLMSVPRMVVSDEEGRFAITGLPEGSYTLTTQKAAWVPLASSVRTSGQGLGQGVPVAVKAGEAVRGITLRMARGAVISGVVRLAGGRPAAGMSVQVLRTSRVDGRRSASMTTIPGTTDDQGRYRIYGLEAGEYVVQVRSNMFGSFMGADTDTREVLPSEVRWAEAAAAQSATQVAAAARQPPPDLGPTVTYTTTYYPGTAYLSDAGGLQLRTGEERLNVDFAIKKVPTATVSGSVIGLDGTPAASTLVTLSLPATGQEDVFSQMLGAARTTTRADGTFVMTGVSPGNYQLVVRAAPPRPTEPGGRQVPPSADAAMAAAMAGVMGPFGGGVGGALALWARESISVDGNPVGPIALQLREGLTVSGSIVFEGGAPSPMPNVRVTMAEPTPMTGMTGMPDMSMFMPGQSSLGQVKPDSTFELTGVAPGVYLLGVVMPGLRASLTTPGEGWVVKSARVGDRDLMDGGVDVTGGSAMTGLVVTLTKRPSEITGRVLDGASRPFSAFPLVIFSADRTHWTAGSRRVQHVQPATNGSYVFAGLPAGKYYLAAVTGLDTRELASTAFLESLIGSAITVTLSDGERKTQDVKLAGGT